MSGSTLRLLVLFAFCLLNVVVSHAQSATATLSGTVMDQQGAVVPGAIVTATNTATGLQRLALTNDGGQFTIPLLPPSTYAVTVERQSFAPAEIQNVALNVGEQRTLQIQLRVGQVGETVTISEGAPLVQSETPEVGTLVDRQFVENLPLNGRTFQSLIALTPGVVITKTTPGGEQGQFSVNGQRPNANYFMIDGVSASAGISPGGQIGQAGTGALPGLAVTGGTNSLVSVDALQEFRVQTSTYSPEFGRQPGAQVLIVTRSGTNQYHGTLFEYFRNEALDANDWFANSRGLAKAPLRQNDFGGVMGGPLPFFNFGEGGPVFHSGLNRTFFFFSYEGLRLRLPQVRLTTVPSLAARAAAPAQIGPFLNTFPRPNGRDLGGGLAEFSASYSEPSTINATSIRVDHNIGSNLTMFGRYNHAPSYTSVRGDFGGSLNQVLVTRLATRTFTAGATWTVTPRVSNDLRFNYSLHEGSGGYFLDQLGGGTNPPSSILFPPYASPENSIVTFFFSETGFGGPGFTVGRNSGNRQRQINVVNNLTAVAGSHQLRFGVDYRQLAPEYGSRNYYQQSFVNPVTGVARFAFVQGEEAVALAYTNFSAYGQDTWKISRRLTFTYGMRWEVNPPPTGRNGLGLFTVQNVDNLAALSLAPPGTPLYETTYDNFAPRLGVAYQLSQRPGRETVLRGGIGVFYDLRSGLEGNAPTAFPYSRSKFLFNVPFPIDPTVAAPPPFRTSPPVASIYVSDPKIELPRTYQWNAAAEQALGTNQVISVSYVGAAGRRLLRQERPLNPNPNFQMVNIQRSIGTSDYHAMQVEFQRRLSRGLQALLSYTWSHSIDDASSETTLFAPDNRISLRQERGSSDFDVRHSFAAAATYNLTPPDLGAVGNAFFRNWAVDAIYRARTATPVDVRTGRQIFGSNEASRPDLVPGIPLYVDDPAVPGDRRINRNAFALPPIVGSAPQRQGTLGRNALRGFPSWQLDFALRRQFNFTERLRLQLRGEMFNAFNHPNFADPTGNLTSGLFGQSTQMLGRSLGGLSPLYQIGGPRSIQLAVRLLF
jgi:hypothetical protein